MTCKHATAERPLTKMRGRYGLVVLALALALALAFHLASCSTQQPYAIGQAWQRNQCFKISDAQERDRCLASTSASYEEYERRSRATTTNNPGGVVKAVADELAHPYLP